MPVDHLSRLQAWYKSQCNGEWEHAYGVSLKTLDNPGWRLTIDIKATPLETRTFERIEFQSTSDEDDWYQCWIDHADKRQPKFSAAGGPHNLSRMIEIFLDWAENDAT